MSEIVGFNITPDSGTSLRKVLKYNLEAHMERFEAISAAASKVHSVYNNLFLSLSFIHVHCTCTCSDLPSLHSSSFPRSSV